MLVALPASPSSSARDLVHPSKTDPLNLAVHERRHPHPCLPGRLRTTGDRLELEPWRITDLVSHSANLVQIG